MLRVVGNSITVFAPPAFATNEVSSGLAIWRDFCRAEWT
jgi:hypothetical protein